MKKAILATMLGLTVLVGCAVAATWTKIELNEQAVAACFDSNEKARVVIIYSNFQGDVEEVRCYPTGEVN